MYPTTGFNLWRKIPTDAKIRFVLNIPKKKSFTDCYKALDYFKIYLQRTTYRANATQSQIQSLYSIKYNLSIYNV